MSYKHFAVGAILLVLVLFLTSSCNHISSGIRVAHTGSYGPGHAAYDYATLSGTDRWMLAIESGEILRIDYDARVRQGKLTLGVHSINGNVLWEQVFAADDSDALEIAIEEAGRYQIVMAGEGTRGGYELNWALVE